MTFCPVHFSRLWLLLNGDPAFQNVSSFLQFGAIHEGAKGAFLHTTQVAVRYTAPELNHRTPSSLAPSCALHHWVQSFKHNSPAALPTNLVLHPSPQLWGHCEIICPKPYGKQGKFNVLPLSSLSSHVAMRLNKHNFPLVILCRLFPIIYYPSCTRERFLWAVTYHASTFCKKTPTKLPWKQQQLVSSTRGSDFIVLKCWHN